MVDTGYHYPATVVSHHDASPYWSNPDYVEDNEAASATEGGGSPSYPHATVNMTSGVMSDGLRSTDYGFTIPSNARIDGVTAKTVRSGAYIRDFTVQLFVYDPSTERTLGLSNKGKKRARTDGYYLVDTYGSTSDLWGASAITPEQLNQGSAGLWWRGAHNASGVQPAWHHCLALKAEYTEPTYSLSSTLPDAALQDDIIVYTITLTNTNSIDHGVPIPVEIPIPSGFTFLQYYSAEGSYDSVTETWTPILDGGVAYITIVVQCTGSGNQSQTITETEFSTTITDTCNILVSDVGDINTTTAVIDDPVTLANMEDGETYTLSAYNKLHDTGYAGVYAGIYNHRLAVVNGTETLGGRVTAQDAYQRVGASFVYDENETLTLKLYGQYENVSTVADEYWAGFTLKKGYDTTYSEAGNLLADPDSLLTSLSTTITLPASEDGEAYDFTFNTPQLDGVDSPVITGLTLSLDTADTTGLGLTIAATTATVTGEVKSTTLLTEYGDVPFGDETDLWGLTSDTILDEELTFTIIPGNTTLSEITPTLGDLTLTFHYLDDETWGAMGWTYNGEHSSTYQVYMTGNDHPSGVANKIQTLTINGMDGELITGQTIQSKEIKVSFTLWGDTVEEVMTKLDGVTTWLTNPRTSLGLPTPLPLIFDYDPTRTYMAVFQGPLEVETVYTTVRCTATFLVPLGCALGTDIVVTGAVGSTTSLLAIQPTVTVVADGSSSIVITDTPSGQALTIDHTVTSGKLVTVNCQERTVTDEDSNDLTGDVSLDSDWFRFQTEYDLSVTGGLIQSVSYYEGI